MNTKPKAVEPMATTITKLAPLALMVHLLVHANMPATLLIECACLAGAIVIYRSKRGT